MLHDWKSSWVIGKVIIKVAWCSLYIEEESLRIEIYDHLSIILIAMMGQKRNEGRPELV